MKNRFSIVLVLALFIISTSFTISTLGSAPEAECGVAQFYEAVEADYGVKVLTSYGDLEKAELIFKPAKMDEGNYKIKITRVGSNLYKMEESPYYIETKSCYEFASYKPAMLIVEIKNGHQIGKVVFK